MPSLSLWNYTGLIYKYVSRIKTVLQSCEHIQQACSLHLGVRPHNNQNVHFGSILRFIL